MNTFFRTIYNAPWMFLWVGILLIFVILQSIVYMKRAWSRGAALGLESAQMRKALTTGVSISVLPTLPVLVVFLALVSLLGIPLPWLRLSIIGSASYESYAASVAVQSVGEELTTGGYSTLGWVAAAWVMTVGGSACVIWSICAIKPIHALYNKIEKFDIKLVTEIGTGCLCGVMGYVSVAQGWGEMSTKGVVFTISFLCGALMVFLQKKFAKLKWLSNYLMAISMIIAMVAACFIF